MYMEQTKLEVGHGMLNDVQLNKLAVTIFLKLSQKSDHQWQLKRGGFASLAPLPQSEGGKRQNQPFPGYFWISDPVRNAFCRLDDPT